MEIYNYNFILTVDFPKIDLKNRSQNPAVVAEWREQPLPNMIAQMKVFFWGF